MIRRIYFFRHGQTDWNAEGRIQGHLDIPLNDRGRTQADALIQPLRRVGVEAFLSSDLSRALETAEIIAARLGVPVHQDAGLREIHLGELQGLSRSEIQERFGEEFSTHLRHHPLSDADVARLGSESGEQVVTRSLGAVRKFLTEWNYQRIGVATHGGVIRRIVQTAAGSDRFPPPITNCVLYPVSYRIDDDRWELEPLIEIECR